MGAPTRRCRWSLLPPLIAVLLGSCGDHRPSASKDPPDSASLAQRESRRQKFLEEQAAQSLHHAAVDGRLVGTVIVTRPTLVVFRPGMMAIHDSHPVHPLLKAAVDSARAAGWDVTERSTQTLRILDATTQAIYLGPVALDSAGIALVAPGYPPQVSYGLGALLEVGPRLRAFDAWRQAQARSARVPI